MPLRHRSPARRASPLLLLGALPFLAACGGDDGTTSTNAAQAKGAASTNGSLVFATDKEPECFDTQVSQSDVSGVLMRGVYESLVRQQKDGSFRPWLATKWSVSDDARTFTFTLRDDVRFSDGTRFDAAAVKTNLDRIADPRTKSKYAISLLGPYRDTTVVDPTTVRVRFDKPFATFLRNASTTYLGFHSPRSIEEHGSRLCAGGPDQVGTGPFLLRSYTRGQQAVLERNPSYAAPGAKDRAPAKLARLTFRFVPDPTVRVGSALGGEVDAADAVPPNQLPKVERSGTLQLVSTATPGVGYTWYLNTDQGPFVDRRLRLAVQKAFDGERATKAVYFGAYDRAWSVLSPTTLGYDPGLQGTWGFDRTGAEALLDEAGWTGRDGAGYRTKDGRRLSTRLLFVPEYTSEDRAALDQALQADLKRVGVELKLVPLDSAAYEPVRNAGRYGIVGFAWGGGDPDLLRVLFQSDQRFDDGGNNAARLRDDQVDAGLREGGSTTDVAARKAAYSRVQRRLIGEGIALPTAVQQRQIAVREGVSGLTFDANGWPLFHDVAK